MAEKWWANMNNYDEAKQKTHLEIRLKQVFSVIHLCLLLKKGQCFVFGKLKKEFQDSDLQNFVDGPDAIGVHMGLDQPLNNHCQKIDHDLIGGDGPYPRRF